MNTDYSKALIILFFCFFSVVSYGQDDPTLFEVGDARVGLSEFDYIYSKTNGKEATYSEESLRSYLDLYVKFKLKVQEAKRIQMDTIPKLQRELDTYRRQLADSYLMDKEVTEKLAQEAFDRMQKDVKAKHILVALAEDASEEKAKQAYSKAAKIKIDLNNGEPFGKAAVKHSDHKPSKLKGGDLGYMTAMLPKGFYDFETALYTQPLKKVSDPIRSKLGYHLLVVEDRRPARGKMDLSHILIRNKDSRNQAVEKSKIDTAYARLQRGVPWKNVTAMLSEDKQSASKAGYIGTYGIGLLEPVFEDAAFALQADGNYSEPFKSSVGWHVVRRDSKKGGGLYQDLRDQILKSLNQTERQEIAKKSLIENVKTETNFKLNEANLDAFIQNQSKAFFTYKWKPTGKNGDDVLFEMMGDYPQTVNDFEAFIVRASRARMRMGQQADLATGVKEVFDLFVEEKALKFEEKNLLKKYSDFRNLMREYEEGILLFEVTDQEVWSKASKDTSGLRSFFKTVDGKFRFADKAVVDKFTMNTTAPKMMVKLKKWATKKSAEKVIAKMKKKGINVAMEQMEIDKGKNPMIDKLPWKMGSASTVQKDGSESKVSVIRKVIPGRAKSLKEARGYVIADYQTYLEQEWIKELKDRFPYKLNEDVLQSLIK